MGLGNIDKIYADAMDRVMFVLYVILMGILEGFWNILINLDENDRVEGEIFHIEKIKRCSFLHKKMGAVALRKSYSSHYYILYHFFLMR